MRRLLIFMNKLLIIYNHRNHGYARIVDKVVNPYLLHVHGAIEDFEEHSEFVSLTEPFSSLVAFHVDKDPETKHKDIANFARKRGIRLEKLAEDTYFVRSLSRRKNNER